MQTQGNPAPLAPAEGWRTALSWRRPSFPRNPSVSGRGRPDRGSGASDRPSLPFRDEHTRTSLMGGSQLAGRDSKGPKRKLAMQEVWNSTGDTTPGEGFCPGTTHGRVCVLIPPSVPNTSAWSETFGIRNSDLLWGGGRWLNRPLRTSQQMPDSSICSRAYIWHHVVGKIFI